MENKKEAQRFDITLGEVLKAIPQLLITRDYRPKLKELIIKL